MSEESIISCNDFVVIGKPISRLSSYEGEMTEDDYIVVSKKTTVDGVDKYNSYKYGFSELNDRYVHVHGNQNVYDTKTFENINCGKLTINGDEEGESLRINGGNTRISGTLTNNANIQSYGNITVHKDSQVDISGDVDIGGNITFPVGSKVMVRTDEYEGGVVQENTEDRISVKRQDVTVDGLKEKNILDIYTNKYDYITHLSIGDEKVKVYSSNPGNNSDVSSIDIVATTRFVNENFCDIVRYQKEMSELSATEKRHDDNTVHLSGNENIIGTKTMDSASIFFKVSSDSQYSNVLGFQDSINGKPLGTISLSTVGEGFDSNVMRIQCNSGNNEYRSYIELRADKNNNCSITQNIDPRNEYGNDLATTKWTRDQMIELSDQTHDYTQIVNADEGRTSGSGIVYGSKQSPSTTCIKDYNEKIIKPQTQGQIEKALSDYCAYDYDAGSKTVKIPLQQMRLVKFEAQYKGKDDIVPFYVMTPMNTENN